MTPEYVRDFRLAAAKTQILQQALEYAVGNLDVAPIVSEISGVESLSRFDHVIAFWLEPHSELLRWKRIKGPDEMKTGVDSLNAIPVANEAEAERWRDLLAGTVTPRRALKPRLIAAGGSLVRSQN